MSPRRLPRLLARALGLVLAVAVLASCGDDSGAEDAASLADLIDETTTTSTTEVPTTTTTAVVASPSEYVAALAEELEDPTGVVPIDASQSECLAEAIVEVPGPEALAEAGISPTDLAASPDGFASLDVELPTDAVDRLAERLPDCIDLRAAMLAGFESGIPGVDASCLVDGVEDGDLDRLVARLLIEGGDGYSAGVEWAGSLFDSAGPECATEVLLGGLVGQGTVTEEQADCLAGQLDPLVAQRLFQAAASGADQPDPADADALAAAGAACGVA